MKLGLCFSGGGARGAYQIGASRAMEELGLLEQVYAFSGTSIGSVNACLVASRTTSEARDLWLSVTPDMLKRSENIFKNIIKERLQFNETGIYDMAELEKMLDRGIEYNRLRIKRVYVTLSEAGNVNEGILGLFKNSYRHYVKKDSKVVYSPVHTIPDKISIQKQIMASCSIPIVFKPTIMGDSQYYDGGVYDNVPVKPLIEQGCDTIIVVHLHRIHFFDKMKYPSVRIVEIQSKRRLGGFLNFDPAKSETLMEYGYEDAMKILQDEMSDCFKK